MNKKNDKKRWCRGARIIVLVAALLLMPWLHAGAAEPQVAAGQNHAVGLRSNGTVVAIGDNSDSQTDVGAWSNIAQIAAGDWHTVGRKYDGSVVATGNVNAGIATANTWTGMTQVAAGGLFTVGLTSGGTVIGAGDNTWHQIEFDPALWTDLVRITAGGTHTAGLKSDGTVVAAGSNSAGQTDVESWTNILQVACGFAHTVGLRSDGTVVAVGYNADHQTEVSSWTNITAIAAGQYHTVGLRSDGTVVAAGNIYTSQVAIGSWDNIVSLVAGANETMGIRPDGTVVAVGDNTYGQTDVGSWALDLEPAMNGARGTRVTLEGSGFGSKKGQVSLAGTPAKIIAWFDGAVIFELDKPLLPDHRFFVTVTPNGKGAVPITSDKPVATKAPQLQFFKPNHGPSGAVITLSGKYFGSKKGKVYLGTKLCTVLSWYMNPETGRSMVSFTVPPKMAPGNYNISLVNDTASATFPVRVFTME